MLHAVVMAGGSGTRFWPLSRRGLPKQLLRVVGPQTLLQATCERAAQVVPVERTWIVTGESLVDETRRQVPRVSADRVLAEPVGRNTAPCIGLAAERILADDPAATLLVLPADHVVSPPEAFAESVRAGETLLSGDPRRLVLWGVPPTYPATGFGYLEQGAAVSEVPAAWRVARFCEKPDRALAEQFVASGKHFWNSGIFLWRAATILDRLAACEPELRADLRQLAAAAAQAGWPASVLQGFPRLKSISIDYAVLERTPDDVVMLRAPFAWDDVGGWAALGRWLPRDAVDNAVAGTHVGIDTARCVVRGEPDHLIATVGVEDLVIVQTPDATLVARRDDEEGLRRLIEQLRARGLDRHL